MKRLVFITILVTVFGGLKAQVNDNTTAIDTIKTVSAAESQKAEKIYNQGIVYYQQGKLDEAITQFDEAIKIKPNFAKAYFNRATAKAELKKYAESISDYNMAILLEPTAKSYFSRGLIRYKLKDYTGAESDFDNCIQNDVSNLRAQAYYYQGCVYFDQNKYEEAIARDNKAIEYKPDYAFAYNDRGSANRQLEKYQEALKDYRRAIQLNPQMAFTFNNMASVKKKLGDLEGAITDYSSAIELKPDYYIAYNNRGSVYMMKKEYNKALADFTQAISLKSDYAYAYNNRGNVKYKQKRYEDAIQDYTKAVEIDPTYGYAFLNRGILRKCFVTKPEHVPIGRKLILWVLKEHTTMFNHNVSNLRLKYYEKYI